MLLTLFFYLVVTPIGLIARIAGRDYSVSIRAGCPVRARVADIAGPLLGVRGLVNDGFEVKKRLPGNPHPS